jgi:ribosomal protein S26
VAVGSWIVALSSVHPFEEKSSLPILKVFYKMAKKKKKAKEQKKITNKMLEDEHRRDLMKLLRRGDNVSKDEFSYLQKYYPELKGKSYHEVVSKGNNLKKFGKTPGIDHPGDETQKEFETRIKKEKDEEKQTLAKIDKIEEKSEHTIGFEEAAKIVSNQEGKSGNSNAELVKDHDRGTSGSPINKTLNNKSEKSWKGAFYLDSGKPFRSQKYHRKKGEGDVKLVERMKSVINPGVNFHVAQDGVHLTTEGNCRTCSKIKPKNKAVKRFEHHEIRDEKHLVELWSRIPSNKMPVFYCEYADSNLHMTMIYRPCHVNEAIALLRFSNQMKSQFPELEVTISGKSQINGYLYPGKEIYSVKVSLNRSLRSILSKINFRKWEPHVTDHTGNLKIGDRLKFHFKVKVLFALLNDPVVNEDAVKSYYPVLKLEEELDNGVEEGHDNVQQEEEKSDPGRKPSTGRDSESDSEQE